MDVTVAEISRIKTGSPAEKRKLLDHLLRSGSPAALDLAIDALGDPDWTVRSFASERLAALGARVIERLGKVLSAGDENQRYWAVRALVGIGSDAVPLLLKILGRGPKAMRLHAATALGEIRDPVAIPYLVAALGDEVWQVRYNAYEGLLLYGEAALPPLEKALRGESEDRAYWAAKALGKLGEKSRDTLLDALKTGNRRLRFVVAAALGETGDLRVVKVLVNYTRDRSWIVRKRSSEALAEIGRVAIPLIVEELEGEEGPHTRWLLAALCKMGRSGQAALGRYLVKRGEAFAWNVKDELVELDGLAAPLFLELVKIEDQDLRFFATTCLGELTTDPKVDEALLACLEDPCWSIRKVAADALAQRGTAILPRLAQAMEVGNEDLRYWVTVVFRKMGAVGVDELIKALQDSNSSVAYFAATALAEVPEKRVIRPLIRALASRSWPVRNAASTSLSLLADLSIESLVNAIEDEHEDVSFWVDKTIKRIGRAALPDISRLLHKGTDEQRLHAAKAMGSLRDPAAVEALITALADGHEWVRLYAALALGEIGDRRSLEELVKVLADPSFRVHPRMIPAFEKFGDSVVPELLALADGDEEAGRANALFVLGARRTAAAFDRIVKATQDPEEAHEVRLSAVQALGHYQDRVDAVEALGAVIDAQGSGPLRSKAILALGESELDEAVPVLLRAAATAENREDETRVGNILDGQGPRLIPTLIECLGNKDVGVRKSAADVLERMGAVALPYLRTAALEGDQNVRFWGQKLVKKLGEKKVRE